MPELSAAEREDLLEFHQSVCCDAGHRVEKSGMKRLSEIGAVESCGFGKHRLTEFGVYLLGLNSAPAAPAADAGLAAVEWAKDAAEWGGALNYAAWEFVNECPEKSALLFNNTKGPLRAAIMKYAELVAANAKDSSND